MKHIQSLTLKEVFFLMGIFNVLNGLWCLFAQSPPETPKQTIMTGTILLIIAGGIAFLSAWNARLRRWRVRRYETESVSCPPR